MSVAKALIKDICEAAGADTLGLAGALKLGLIKGDFNPENPQDLVGADEATFAGAAAKAVGAATRTVAEDPPTGDVVINIPAATGGNVFESTAAPDPVEEIKGWYLGTDTLGVGTVYKCDYLYDENGNPTTVVISDADQQVTVPLVNIRALRDGIV